jgi:hypothetical protein
MSRGFHCKEGRSSFFVEQKLQPKPFASAMIALPEMQHVFELIVTQARSGFLSLFPVLPRLSYRLSHADRGAIVALTRSTVNMLSPLGSSSSSLPATPLFAFYLSQLRPLDDVRD